MTDPIANSLEVVAEIEARQKKRINLVDKICNSPSVDGRAKLPAMPSWNQQECLDDCDTLLTHIDTLQRELAAANEWIATSVKEAHFSGSVNLDLDAENTELKAEIEKLKAIKMGPDTPVSCSHNWEYTTGGWVCAMCGMTLPFMDTSITAK